MGDTVRAVVNNPNIRCLISNATDRNAKSFLNEIKQHFISTKKFLQIFGDYVPRDQNKIDQKKWSETQIVVSKRTANLKEPTIQAAGVGSEVTSQHYERIVCDDLVNYKNSRTPELREKLLDWFKVVLSLLEPDGELIVIGTRYYPNDLYGWIIKNNHKFPPGQQFDIMVRQAFEDGEPIYPEKYSKEVLEGIRSFQGSKIWSGQYLNNPKDPEASIFHADHFRYYDTLPEPHKCRAVLRVDPAISKKDNADNFAIGLMIYEHATNKKYYPHKWKGKGLSPRQQVQRILKSYGEYKEYKPTVIIETTAYQEALKYLFVEECQKRGVSIQIKEVKPNTDKVTRANSVQAFVERGEVFLASRDEDWLEEVEMFPNVDHDDQVDVFIGCLEEFNNYNQNKDPIIGQMPGSVNIREEVF